MDDKIRLGVSTCLMGENVRYDGGHKRDPFLVNTLGQYVEWVPVCPEVEAGFSTPREAMRLIGAAQRPRLVTQKTGIDHTERMESWARARVEQLASEELNGFVFMRASPSSGMERVKVYNDKGMPEKVGVGIFARIFMERFPLLPVEENGRLHDPTLRENFIERIFTLARFRDVVARGRTMRDLVDFHTRNKLLIMSHSPKHLEEMGRLVAGGKSIPAAELFESYQALLLSSLQIHATPPKHINTLQHIMGYFKKVLTADEKQELLEVFEAFRNGLVPLIVPITLIRHYTRKYDESYLKQQTYLDPHPLELKLRNHV